MALKTTQRDKIIVSVLLPLALAAGYWHFYARKAAQTSRALEQRAAACPALEDSDALLARARAQAAQACAKFEAAQAEPANDGELFAETPPAERMAAFARLLQRHGIILRTCTAAAAKDGADERLSGLLRRAGVSQPAFWRVEADAPYAAFTAFLDELSSSPSPVLIHSLVLAPDADARRPSHWKFTACL